MTGDDSVGCAEEVSVRNPRALMRTTYARRARSRKSKVPFAGVRAAVTGALLTSSSTSAPSRGTLPLKTRPRISPRVGTTGAAVRNDQTVAFPENAYPSEAPAVQ